jgi:lipopolysaccharide/colanic/teichoic acid biosynthesis glycosyltransferase
MSAFFHVWGIEKDRNFCIISPRLFHKKIKSVFKGGTQIAFILELMINGSGFVNMKTFRTYSHNLALLILLFVAVLFAGTTALAALSVVDTAVDRSAAISFQDDIGVQTASSPNKSRAPEPSTMALFFTGFCTMVVSFVRKTYAAIKRALDICAGIAGLILLSPLFLLVTILIKIFSPGPVFYSQVRVGKEGQLFRMYKFRSMRTDAENGTGAVWAKERDDRVIPYIGNLMRKAHIDEIPQFINILKGDMSLIGPRPERPEFVEKFKTQIPEYEKRLQVKPGLTGLAQVWHRYDRNLADVKKKIKYDLLYIKKLCLWTDFRILLRTFRVVLTGEGAH